MSTFRASGGMPSGPAAFPDFSDLMALAISASLRGSVLTSRSSDGGGMSGGAGVERFLDVFRPSNSLLLLDSYGVSVLNFDRAAGVSVLPRESSGDLVEPLHVSFVYCSLCL